MAITRAQQAKQLLANGGRIGLKEGKMSDNRQQYSAQQTQTGRVKGGGPGGKTDAFVSGDTGRESRQEFETAVGRSQLDNMKIKDSGIPGIGGMILDAFKGPRQKLLDRNVDYFKSLSGIENKGYPKTAEGYKNYMADRLAGK